MRKHFFLPALLATTLVNAQAPADSTGLPGDHFSLEGALNLFKQAKDLDDFEKSLNTESNNVNNLDLNGDGNVDYVRVESRKEGDAFAIVMQVPVSKDEAQDVAVIELEKNGEASALVQIKGDEDLYGPDEIVEPYAEAEDGKGSRGPGAPDDEFMWVTMNVWMWPCVQWCYGPSFVLWYSPWYWDYYPVWWHPWHHAYWHHWHHHQPHYSWCHHVDFYRNTHAHNLYGGHRKASPTVQRNTAARKEQMVREGRQAPGRVQPDKREGEQPRVAPRTGDPGKVEPHTTPRTKPVRKQDRTRKAPAHTPAPSKPRRSR
ncbi:MAG: hypothetical protein WAU70_11425 [Flavobacteriales bacterium]